MRLEALDVRALAGVPEPDRPVLAAREHELRVLRLVVDADIDGSLVSSQCVLSREHHARRGLPICDDDVEMNEGQQGDELHGQQQADGALSTVSPSPTAHTLASLMCAP